MMNRLNQLLALCLLLCCCPTLLQAATLWRDGTPRTAIVDMFEWDWNSIAKECTNYLGPKGFAAIKVSPPQEDIQGSQWWTRYQPVSYQLISRSGNRQQFQQMVAACKTAGVDIYVDAVINHMASGSGTGSGVAGSYYDSNSLYYPAASYGSTDFHPNCPISQSATECWLESLPDLNTESSHVRSTLAAYINDLQSLGVTGIYIDAAEHISVSDLQAILALTPNLQWIGQETWWLSIPGPTQLLPYTQVGNMTEFSYFLIMKYLFLDYASLGPAAANYYLSAYLITPSDKALVFINNHDVERTACNGFQAGAECSSLSSFDGATFFLANSLMLAYPYGQPLLHSGYYFSDSDMGPPTNPPYKGSEQPPANCSSSITLGSWDCNHRDWRIGNMVGFRNYTHGAPLANWYAASVDQFAFQRSGKGFIAINNSSTTPWQQNFATGLPDGSYCNVVASANPETGNCPASTQVTVSNGWATLSLPPQSLVALHIGAKVVCNQPNAFSFAPVSNAVTGSLQTSASITITGNSCAAPVSISGGLYRIGNGNYTSSPGSILAGQTLQLQVTAPGSAQVNVGQTTVSFTVTTTPCASGNTCIGAAAAGSPLTLYYKGSLANSASVNVHWGINGWTNISDTAMKQGNNGWWSATLTPAANATELDLVFDSNGQWDNNSGQNWQYPLTH